MLIVGVTRSVLETEGVFVRVAESVAVNITVRETDAVKALDIVGENVFEASTVEESDGVSDIDRERLIVVFGEKVSEPDRSEEVEVLTDLVFVAVCVRLF